MRLKIHKPIWAVTTAYRSASLAVLLLAGVLHAADTPPAACPLAPIRISGGYAVVTSQATWDDPEWKPVVETLASKYGAPVIRFKDALVEARAPLAAILPRYCGIVLRPQEATRELVIATHRTLRQLNDDPYGDTLWGIVTGYKPQDALRIINERQPLVIHKGAAGTPLNLGLFDQGVWYNEGEAGMSMRKGPDGKEQRVNGPADSTGEIVDTLNNEKPDLFMTSGHASEHDWALGYNYPNGRFRSKDGVMYGVDLQRHKHAVNSPNPKVYLAAGNCLMGHIADQQSMVLAWLGSCGVRQMIGYTVVTWYGFGGWGTQDYFLGQPGRFSLAESFYLNNQLLEYKLEHDFPGKPQDVFANYEMESDPGLLNQAAEKLGYKADSPKLKDHLGLLWDRDVVAFYGDPAWDARLAAHNNLPWEQSLTENAGTFTFIVHAAAETNCARPPAALLPYRVKEVAVIEGQNLAPLITGLFVMLPEQNKLEKDKTYKLIFKAQPAQGAAR